MKKRLIISSLIFTITFSSLTTFSRPVKAYEVKKYNKGHVYIINEHENINPSENDVLVIDLRKKSKNIRILDSYKIIDVKDIFEIIDIILEYDKENPVQDYNRSRKSLINEWLVHNALYYLFIERDRTKSVDFQNTEENIYILKPSVPH